MGNEDLIGQVRELRAAGRTPKQIARALGLPPAQVAPLVRAIAAADQASPTERTLLGCWVSAGWSEGLTINSAHHWPDVDTTDSGTSGLVNVLIARDARYDKVSVCGYLLDVYCLGVKNVVGPRVLNAHAITEFTRSYFSAYHTPPLAAPIELAQHLVFGAAEYARHLGFDPHPDFPATTSHIGAPTGPAAITFGRHGKPFFVNGPHDNPAAIIRTLEQSVGRKNFHYLIING